MFSRGIILPLEVAGNAAGALRQISTNLQRADEDASKFALQLKKISSEIGVLVLAFSAGYAVGKGLLTLWDTWVGRGLKGVEGYKQVLDRANNSLKTHLDLLKSVGVQIRENYDTLEAAYETEMRLRKMEESGDVGKGAEYYANLKPVLEQRARAEKEQIQNLEKQQKEFLMLLKAQRQVRGTYVLGTEEEIKTKQQQFSALRPTSPALQQTQRELSEIFKTIDEYRAALRVTVSPEKQNEIQQRIKEMWDMVNKIMEEMDKGIKDEISRFKNYYTTTQARLSTVNREQQISLENEIKKREEEKIKKEKEEQQAALEKFFSQTKIQEQYSKALEQAQNSVVSLLSTYIKQYFTDGLSKAQIAEKMKEEMNKIEAEISRLSDFLYQAKQKGATTETPEIQQARIQLYSLLSKREQFQQQKKLFDVLPDFAVFEKRIARAQQLLASPQIAPFARNLQKTEDALTVFATTGSRQGFREIRRQTQISSFMEKYLDRTTQRAERKLLAGKRLTDIEAAAIALKAQKEEEKAQKALEKKKAEFMSKILEKLEKISQPNQQ